MLAHTQGPWEVSKHATPASHPQFGVHAGGNDFAIVKGSEADARLIAAAPDLLATLKRIADEVDKGPGFADETEHDFQVLGQWAKDAIAKARGA